MEIDMLMNHRPPHWTNTLAWTLAGVLALANVAGSSGPEQAPARETAPGVTSVAAGKSAPEAVSDADGRGAAEDAATTPAAEEPPAPPAPRARDTRRAAVSSPGRPATAGARAATARGSRAAQQRPDFAFGRPGHSIGIRGQWHRARAESDIYDFVTEELTLEKSDFNATGVAVDVGFALTSRLEGRVGLDYTRAFARSESRGYRDTEGIPIEQDTLLRQVGITGSVAFALAPRGRAVGRYAWIPSPVVPYVGAGAGLIRYEFEQVGDFVDFVDFAIFTDRFNSAGWGLSAHLFGGVDIRLTPRILLTTEVRRVQAQADLGDTFSGYDPIDLDGLQIAAGVRFVF